MVGGLNKCAGGFGGRVTLGNYPSFCWGVLASGRGSGCMGWFRLWRDGFWDYGLGWGKSLVWMGLVAVSPIDIRDDLPEEPTVAFRDMIATIYLDQIRVKALILHHTTSFGPFSWLFRRGLVLDHDNVSR